MASIGSHCILELYDCPERLLDDPTWIRNALREAAEEAKATLLGEVSHEFTPQGVTAVAILAESHISVHTWPELGYVAADVFTCGAHTQPEEACRVLARAFRAGHHELRTVGRGSMEVARQRRGNGSDEAQENFPWQAQGLGRISG